MIEVLERIEVPAALTLTPLGILVRIDAETCALGDAAAAACKRWSAPQSADARALSLALSVGAGSAGSGEPAIAIEGERLTLSGGEVAAEADAVSGRARCRVSPSLADDPERLGREVLEPVLLFLLTRCGRTPIHAAGVVIGERTVILAGASGAGKSCLALAATTAGLPLLSDDTLFVERGPPPTIWALPRAIHVFAADARGAFGGPERLRNGKLKRAVPVARQICVSRLPPAFCVLARGARASLVPLAATEALAALPPLEPGFDLLAEEIAGAFAALAAPGAWRLTLSADPAEAIALLGARFGAAA